MHLNLSLTWEGASFLLLLNAAGLNGEKEITGSYGLPVNLKRIHESRADRRTTQSVRNFVGLVCALILKNAAP